MRRKKMELRFLYERLKEIRTQKNLTRVELAKRTGLSRDVLWRYETGQRTPNSLALAKLMSVLEIYDIRELWEKL